MSKQRLTITLSATTLAKVDQIIDQQKIRSRSHAIDYLLQQYFSPRLTTAVILAGDKETALPRAVTKINRQPLIIYTLNQLQKHGVSRILILTNQSSLALLTTTISAAKLNIDCQFLTEKQPLGTAGALLAAQSKLKNETFYCLHGDILTDLDLSAFGQFHLDHQAIATLAVKPRRHQRCFDSVLIQGNQVVSFHPQQNETVGIVNSGVYLFGPQIFDFIPAQTPVSLEKDVFPKLAKTGKLLAFPFQGLWFDVGSDHSYKKISRQIIN